MNKKLPVFFHIPKNAGTYINNRCFSIMRQQSDGRSPYHIDVLKSGVICYRVLCFCTAGLSDSYKKINNVCYQVNIEDFDLNSLQLFMIRVSDSGFKSYQKDIYALLPDDVQPYEFICLREPYDRIQSLYSYIQSAQSSRETTHMAFGKKSFVEYLNSPQLEGSWLLRNLLNIPNETPVTREHFDKTCKLLDHMFVFNTGDVDQSLAKVFMDCYSFDSSNIIDVVYNNKTQDKINVSFDSLDDMTKVSFLNQTRWDKKLYNNYVH